jgi:hypothetical protein
VKVTVCASWLSAKAPVAAAGAQVELFVLVSMR